MEDIILSLEPAFQRVERFILWHNRYASLLAFLLGHCIFYAIARAGLRPFCAVVLVVLIFHVLDCLKQKRSQQSSNEEQKSCELTQLVLRSYRHLCQTHEQLTTLKTENRVKYSVLLIVSCLVLAYIGVKLNGFYVSYFTMLILFTLPAVVYHKLVQKLLQRLAPTLEQLDQSMQYQRRSLVDPKKLLVTLKQAEGHDDDDDDDVRRLKQNRELLQQEQSRNKPQSLNLSDDEEEEEEEHEQKLIASNDQSQTILDFRQRYQNEANDVAVVPKTTSMGDSSFDMLSDSSSSTTDDGTTRLNELYANIGSDIDGKHRIKIKGDEFKIKGHAAKQRPRLMDASFFQTKQEDNQTFTAPLVNTSMSNPSGEPDLTSFDFLNDYEEKEQ